MCPQIFPERRRKRIRLSQRETLEEREFEVTHNGFLIVAPTEEEASRSF